MPKSKETLNQKTQRISSEFSAHGIVSENGSFICRNCGKVLGVVSNMRKSQIVQHVDSSVHKKNAELKSKHTTPIAEKPKPYTTDLCRVCFTVHFKESGHENKTSNNLKYLVFFNLGVHFGKYSAA